MTHRMLRTALVGLVIATTVAPAVFSQEASDTAYLKYEHQKVDPWGPFVLNLLLPFGIGSFVQGDTTGGLVVAGGQVIGVGLMVVDLTSDNPNGAMLYVGAGLYSAATVAALIFPFTYANAANEKLRRDLGISVSDVSLSEQGLAVTFAVDLTRK